MLLRDSYGISMIFITRWLLQISAVDEISTRKATYHRKHSGKKVPQVWGDAGDDWAWMPESFCGLERCFRSSFRIQSSSSGDRCRKWSSPTEQTLMEWECFGQSSLTLSDGLRAIASWAWVLSVLAYGYSVMSLSWRVPNGLPSRC